MKEIVTAIREELRPVDILAAVLAVPVLWALVCVAAVCFG